MVGIISQKKNIVTKKLKTRKTADHENMKHINKGNLY